MLSEKNSANCCVGGKREVQHLKLVLVRVEKDVVVGKHLNHQPHGQSLSSPFQGTVKREIGEILETRLLKYSFRARNRQIYCKS